MARSALACSDQFGLFPARSQPQSQPLLPAPRPLRPGLWAALRYPRLSLEVLRDEIDASAWVVLHDVRGQQVVQAASGPAQQTGVVAGMPLSAAYALCPELETEWREPQAEQDCLTLLADWAAQYTSQVSLEPQALLLELAGSLQLFGGLAALQARLDKALQQQPHMVQLALAPTPQAALLLARAGVSEAVTELEALRASLAPLSLSLLPLTAKQHALFARLGLRQLRDLWRLPRAGLNKRFGVELGDYLARLLGEKAEPRQVHQTAPVFSAQWSFPLETDNMGFIAHGLEQLLPELERFMRLRGLALNRLQVIFHHSGQQLSRLDWGTQQLCRDAQHLAALLRVRLEQAQLQAPVLSLELRADEFHPFAETAPALFAAAADAQPEAWQRCLDQLHTRLGEAAVSGLQLRDDHRPESAWCEGMNRAEGPALQRPAWLLAQPQRLANSLRDIQLLSEPERIESGWWDGADVRRDYYRGRDGRGRRLWLFQDLNDQQWYLHGLFA